MLTNYARALSLILHSFGDFWLPWIYTSKYMSISFTDQVYEEIMCIWGVQSLFHLIARILWYCSFFLSFNRFPLAWTPYCSIWFIRTTISSCVRIYIIAVILLPSHMIYITCSGYVRLSVYMWGIPLAYIHCRLSSCSVFTFLGSGGDKIFFWYQSQVFDQIKGNRVFLISCLSQVPYFSTCDLTWLLIFARST